MIIRLADVWRDYAVKIGKERFAFAAAQGWRNYGAQEANEEYDICGTVAECGVAKYFKQRWKESVGDITGIDVGDIIEVRGRPVGRAQKDLGFRPKDKPKREMPHVLVWVNADYSMQLMGWLYGYECMHEEDDERHLERWSESSKCWYNPPPYRPLDELSELLANEAEVARIKASYTR